MRISNKRVDTSVVNRNSNLLAQPTFFLPSHSLYICWMYKDISDPILPDNVKFKNQGTSENRRNHLPTRIAFPVTRWCRVFRLKGASVNSKILLCGGFLAQRGTCEFKLLVAHALSFFLSESHKGLKATGKRWDICSLWDLQVVRGLRKGQWNNNKKHGQEVDIPFAHSSHVIGKSTAMKEIWTDKQLRLISVSFLACFMFDLHKISIKLSVFRILCFQVFMVRGLLNCKRLLPRPHAQTLCACADLVVRMRVLVLSSFWRILVDIDCCLKTKFLAFLVSIHLFLAYFLQKSSTECSPS